MAQYYQLDILDADTNNKLNTIKLINDLLEFK